MQTVVDGGAPRGRWLAIDASISDEERRGLVTRPGADGQQEALVVLDRFDVTGGYLSRAAATYDPQTLLPCVEFSFNSTGASLFGVLTGDNLPDPANGLTSRLGIVLDDVLISAPSLRSAITSRGQITGNFSIQEADRLAVVLRSGALPAKLQVVERRVVDASLGADSIRAGVTSSIVGVALVAIFTPA